MVREKQKNIYSYYAPANIATTKEQQICFA